MFNIPNPQQFILNQLDQHPEIIANHPQGKQIEQLLRSGNQAEMQQFVQNYAQQMGVTPEALTNQVQQQMSQRFGFRF